MSIRCAYCQGSHDKADQVRVCAAIAMGGFRSRPSPQPTDEPTPPVCRRCGSSNLARMVYGYPGFALREQAGRGEVVLGGCMVPRNPSTHECADCGWPHWASDDEINPTEGALGAVWLNS